MYGAQHMICRQKYIHHGQTLRICSLILLSRSLILAQLRPHYTYLFPYFDLNKLVQHGHNVLIRGNELQLLLQFKIYFLMLAVFSVTQEIILYEIILIY